MGVRLQHCLPPAQSATLLVPRPRLVVLVTQGNEYWKADKGTLAVSGKKLVPEALWTSRVDLLPPAVVARVLVQAKQLTNPATQLPERQIGQYWSSGIHPTRHGHVARVTREGWATGDAYVQLKPYTKYLAPKVNK